MNKKVFLIPLAIGLAIWIIFELISTAETGNHFVMTVPELSQDASFKSVKHVTVYLDNSGSMKGYVDFAGVNNGAKARASIIGTLSNMMDNVHDTYSIEPVCKCGGFNYARRDFLGGMEDFTIFRGAVTELHNIIQLVADSTNKNDVSIIATDMVMSYGKNKLIAEKDSFYNYHQLEQLGAQVHNAMEKCKNKGLQAVVLHYYSDFNGKYYYNYTENLKPNKYANTLMTNRPYYLVVIGSEVNLRSMMANNCFNKSDHVYASFNMGEPKHTQEYNVEMDNNCRVAWNIGDPGNMNVKGSIMTNTSFGDESSVLYFSCKKINIPNYICLSDEGKLVPEWDSSVISQVEEVSVGTGSTQKFKVTLNPHNKLSTTNDVWIRLNSNVGWISGASTYDDTKDDISKKTWGFSTVMKNINKAYRGTETQVAEKVAEFKFNVIIE